ncbi:MAG TPA: glycosyltransferase 87 family protein [Polyangia bacterium]|jgi:hypothetical protein
MSFRRAAFGATLGLCWLSAGFFPFSHALREVLRPNDFTPDYVTAVAWMRLGQAGRGWPPVLDRATANGYAQSLGARSVQLRGPYYVHPPPTLIPVLPLAALPYRAATAAWLALSLGLLGALAWLLAPLAAEAGVALGPVVLFPLLALWPPVLTNLELGQWSIVLATLLAAGHRAWERGHHRRGAAWMAVAAALKLTPVLLLLALALRERRAAWRFAAVFGGICLVALPLGGLAAWSALLRESGPNAAAWQTFWHNTLSFRGLWARLFVGGAFARPLVSAPLLARALTLAATIVLLGVAVTATRRAARAPADRNREGCVLALWYVLVVILNPLAWPHYAILLLLPTGLAARAAYQAPAPATTTDRPALLLGAAGLALLTIPKETLFLLAAPLPLAPLPALVLSLPLVGALCVFAAAARGARRASAPHP